MTNDDIESTESGEMGETRETIGLENLFKTFKYTPNTFTDPKNDLINRDVDVSTFDVLDYGERPGSITPDPSIDSAVYDSSEVKNINKQLLLKGAMVNELQKELHKVKVELEIKEKVLTRLTTESTPAQDISRGSNIVASTLESIPLDSLLVVCKELGFLKEVKGNASTRSKIIREAISKYVEYVKEIGILIV